MMYNLKLLMIMCLSFAQYCFATDQLGKTYPILEKSALEEINEKASGFKGIKNIELNKTTAFKGYPLPENVEDHVRRVSPFYTLEFDISDAQGNTIYPKGFTYNVAEYVQLPFRIIVFSEPQIKYVKAIKTPTDILLLTEGDIFTVKEQLGGNVFFLDQRLAERLYVEGVPSVVEQEGASYRITEVHFEDDES